jgi:hypothetical protein
LYSGRKSERKRGVKVWMIRQTLAYNTLLGIPIEKLKYTLNPIGLKVTLNNKADLSLKRNKEKTLMIQMQLYRIHVQARASMLLELV